MNNFASRDNNLPDCNLVVLQDGKHFEIEHLNLNMIIKYKNEWHALKLKENSMNNYYLIFREELKTLNEHILNFNSFIASVEPNQNLLNTSNRINHVNIKNQQHVGIENLQNRVPVIKEDVYYPNSKSRILSDFLDKIEEDKKTLYQFAEKEEIDHHYNKLKEVIIRVKTESEENPNDTSNNTIPTTSNKGLLRCSNFEANPNSNGGNNMDRIPIQSNERNSNSNTDRTDVKVLIEDENPVENDMRIFSFISDDRIMSSNNYDSNINHINSYADSRGIINSIFSFPNSDINIDSLEKIVSINSFIGRKRHMRGSFDLFFVEGGANYNDHNDLKNKKLKDNMIKSLFTIKNKNWKLKRFTKNCSDCGNAIKIIKIDRMCCDNYLCKVCIMKNYTFLSELIDNFNVDKFKIDKCVSAQFKIFFCNYCYLIDKRENLNECGCALCFNLFHKDCYIMMKIVDRNQLNLDRKEKTKICEQIVALIIQEDETKQINLINKKIKDANLKFLQSCNDSGQMLMILYKFNKCSFYKFFINYFVGYMIKNKKKFNSDFNFSKDEMVCKNHLCIGCLQPIDELHDPTAEENAISRICCNNIHKECYSEENTHLEYVYHKNSSHLSILHFKFINEFYSFVKKISKYNNNHVIGNRVTEDVQIKEQDDIDKFQVEVILPGIVETSLCTSSYSRLTEKEKEDVMKSYVEIDVNKFSKRIKKDKKIKTQKGLSKCDCINQIVSVYKSSLIQKQNTNLRSSRISSTSFYKYLKDENFQDFLNSFGLSCNDVCSNRILKIECFKNTCDCPAEYCKNRYYRPINYDNYEIIKTAQRGYGLVCNNDIKKGDFIIEYAGEVMDYSELMERNSNLTDHSLSWYSMTLDNNLYIDASKLGNKARFINHSCNPNALVEKWLGRGFTNKILVFASRDIPAGTEICYNYNFNYYQSDFEQECKCGERFCCKIMGGKSSRSGAASVAGKAPSKNSKNTKENYPTLKSNNNIILDDNFNVIIDKNILKDSGIEWLAFNKTESNSNASNMYSLAEKCFPNILSDLKNGKSISDVPEAHKSKQPFLMKNLASIRNNMKKKLLSKESHFSSAKNSNYITEKFNSIFLANIKKSNSKEKQSQLKNIDKEFPAKYSKQSSNSNLLNSYSTSQELIKNNNISTHLKRKGNSMSSSTVNSELIKNIKQASVSNKIEKWKKIKEQNSPPKLKEKFSYSYLILRNETKYENLAVFYEYQNFNFTDKPKRNIVKKIQMLNDRGSISNFCSKVQELFTMLINSITTK